MPQKSPQKHDTKKVGKTLKEKLAECLDEPVAKQLALYEELALARVTAGEAIALGSIALELPSNGASVAEAKAMAIATMRESLDHVSRICLAASRVEADARDKVSIKLIDVFISQINRAIYRVLGPEREDIARQIEAEISATVMLPKEAGTPGTDVTPEIMAMNETVSAEQ